MNFPKKTVGTAALATGAYYGLSQYAPEVFETTGTVAVGVSELLTKGSEFVNVVPNLTAGTFVGGLAPYAFPMVAGGYAGKKLVDVMDIESKTIRKIASVAGVGVGAGLGAAAVSTAFAPILTVAGAGYAGYKGIQGLKYAGRKLKCGVVGGYNGMKAA